MSVHSPLPGMHLMRTRTTSAYVPPLSPPLLVDRPLSPQQPQIIDNNFFLQLLGDLHFKTFFKFVIMS